MFRKLLKKRYHSILQTRVCFERCPFKEKGFLIEITLMQSFLDDEKKTVRSASSLFSLTQNYKRYVDQNAVTVNSFCSV